MPVYVVQQGNPYLAVPTLSYIYEISTSVSGTINPELSLALPTAFVAYAVTVGADGQIYVGGYQGSLVTMLKDPEIRVYPPGSSTPSRILVGMDLPISLAVDASGQIYSAGHGGDLAVYSATANAATPPERLIQGSLTELAGEQPCCTYLVGYSLAIDLSGDIYVTNEASGEGSILMFSATANGNVAPNRIITGTNVFHGIALDSNMNIYTSVSGVNGGDSSIVKYAAGASGAATPILTISGPLTSMSTLGGLRVDSTGNLYVYNDDLANPAQPSLLVYSVGATGNVAPVTQVNSQAWNSASPEISLP